MTPKYDIEVQLSGQDGNVFNLMSLVTRAMKRNGIDAGEREAFLSEVRSSSSYDEALRVMSDWVVIR